MKVIKVLQGPSARYLPATGVLLVSRSAETIYAMLGKQKLDPTEHEELATFVHECVHHLQVLSCAYLWLDAVARIAASVKVVLPGKQEERIEGAEELTRRECAFRYRAFGVSCADLCEGAAVLESYKARAAEPTVNDFLLWRNHFFPGKGNSVYRRTFDVMEEQCGKEAAFDLLPVVTFLALQGDIPGRSFERLITNPRLKEKKLVDASAHEILTQLGYGIPGIVDAETVELMHPSQQHPTLYPILLETARELGDKALDMYARPHRALYPSLDNALPPMIIGPYAEGSFKQLAFGAAYKDKELRRKFMVYTALVATAERMVSGKEAFVPCSLTNCPNHESGVCAGWYAPPPEIDRCGYRAEIRNSSGKELYQIAEDCAQLCELATIKNLRFTNDLDLLFPGAEVLAMEAGENESCAAGYDERHDLDEEDNDGLNTLVCQKCRQFWTEWASRRKMDRGYIAVCPNCGAQQEMGTDRATIIHMD